MTSTVVSLGHFCEVHGPRLVFYTIRNINEPQFVSQCPDFKFCSGCKAPVIEGFISTVQTLHSTPTQTPSPSSTDSSINSHTVVQTSKSSKSFLNKKVSNLKLYDDGEDEQQQHHQYPSTSNGLAERASHATTSTRPGTTSYYCSHSNYDHSYLSHLHSCIGRTLSCELSPNNSVAFTSSEIWVVGTAFSLKDSQARGFHRRYCLIFTFLPESPDSHYTIDQQEKQERKRNKNKKDQQGHHQQRSDFYYSDGDNSRGHHSSSKYPSLIPFYDYITEEFYNLARSLQSECEKVYSKEIASERAQRLNTFLEGSTCKISSAAQAEALHKHRTFPTSSSSQSQLSKNTSGSARSLPLLTANQSIFLDLHEKFAKLLHHVEL